MREQLIKEMNERLRAIEKSVATLTRQHAHTAKSLKEIKQAMAITQADIDAKSLKEIKQAMAITQADIDAVGQQVEDIKTAVTAQGVEIAKIGSDITAFLNQPNLTLDAVKAKLTEVAGLVTNAGTALQNVDDLVPEQPAP